MMSSPPRRSRGYSHTHAKCMLSIIFVFLLSAILWIYVDDQDSKFTFQNTQVGTGVHVSANTPGINEFSRKSRKTIEILDEGISIEAELNKTYISPAEEISIPFRMHVVEAPKCSSLSGESCNDCTKLQPLMQVLETKRNFTESAKLFIVPLDSLVNSGEEGSGHISKLGALLKTIERDIDYLHFGGSDHVFMCLSKGCGKLMGDIIHRSNLGKNTRAMWLGSEEENSLISDQWSCPDRVLNAPQSLLDILGLPNPTESCPEPRAGEISKEIDKVLKMAMLKIEGRNRWECDRDEWDVDVSSMKGRDYQGCAVVPRHGLCISFIPKCGSSTMIYLLRRMNGMKSWNDTHGHTHGSGNGLIWANAKDNFTLYNEVMRDTSWVKITVLREPASRVLSAYLDKMVKLKEFGRIGYRGKTMPSFDYVLDHFLKLTKLHQMKNVDTHFRPLSEFASLRLVRYDFVARVSSLADDIETILRSLGLWEEYGASGWGENGDLSFKDAKAKNAGVVSKENYINNQTLGKIYNIYREDYVRFGFSMKETWGVDPEQ